MKHRHQSFQVIFEFRYPAALKKAVLADVKSLAVGPKDKTTYRLGGDRVTYWVYRSGNILNVIHAAWTKNYHEVRVT